MQNELNFKLNQRTRANMSDNLFGTYSPLHVHDKLLDVNDIQTDSGTSEENEQFPADIIAMAEASIPDISLERSHDLSDEKWTLLESERRRSLRHARKATARSMLRLQEQTRAAMIKQVYEEEEARINILKMKDELKNSIENQLHIDTPSVFETRVLPFRKHGACLGPIRPSGVTERELENLCVMHPSYQQYRQKLRTLASPPEQPRQKLQEDSNILKPLGLSTEKSFTSTYATNPLSGLPSPPPHTISPTSDTSPIRLRTVRFPGSVLPNSPHDIGLPSEVTPHAARLPSSVPPHSPHVTELLSDVPPASPHATPYCNATDYFSRY